jgi:hypothetical protein
VEDITFINLILSVNPGLSKYLVKSYIIIRRWIINEFVIRKEKIKKNIKDSSDIIHVNFNFWTSPNKKVIIVIYAHYLDKVYKPQYILISLKEVYGSYAGANIAEVIKSILIEIISFK